MEQESPRFNLQKFFQFGLHKSIDAPNYYHPKFIPFLKEKKKKSKQIQKLNITRSKSYHMLENKPNIIKRSIPHMLKGQPQSELLVKDKEKLHVGCTSQEAHKERLF
jgi:hypothetical protein